MSTKPGQLHLFSVQVIGLTFAAVAFCRFCVLFPRPIMPDEFEALRRSAARSSARRPHRILGWFGLPWSAPAFAAPLAGIAAFSMLVAGDPERAGHTLGMAAFVGILISLIFPLLLFLHGVVYFWEGYKLLDSKERRQADWVILSLCIYGAVLIVGILSGVFVRTEAPEWVDWLLFEIEALVMLGVVVSLALAIFRAGLFDPTLILRKAALYGVLAVILTSAFVVLEGATTFVLLNQLGFSGPFGPALAGGAVALAFGPMRRQMERLVSGWTTRLTPATALAGGTRRESVVVLTDITGYTRISATDQDTALTLASLLHKEAQKVAAAHQGRLVKTIGDAVLLEFSSSHKAVEACLQLQVNYRDACKTMSLPDIQLRTGAHRGEIVVAPDRDIFGSTVNLAARLEGTADPGQIVVSEEVVSDLEERFRVQPLGSRDLKNVPAAVACFAVSALA